MDSAPTLRKLLRLLLGQLFISLVPVLESSLERQHLAESTRSAGVRFSSSMLPCDVGCSAVGQGSSSNASRGLLAPGRFLQSPARVAAGALRPIGHGLLHQHLGGLAGSSQPRPIPSKHRALATCTVEAPSAPSEDIAAPVDFGYDRNLDIKYDWGKELGKGGNGVVRVVVDRATGQEYACKAIQKVLAGDFSDTKKAGHVDSIKREVEVLRKLSGSLNIVKLVDVCEDEQHVFVVQELCKGGELWHRIGEKHYSERTVRALGSLCNHWSLRLLLDSMARVWLKRQWHAALSSTQQHVKPTASIAVGCLTHSCIDIACFVMSARGVPPGGMLTSTECALVLPCRWRPSCVLCCALWLSAIHTASCIVTSSPATSCCWMTVTALH